MKHMKKLKALSFTHKRFLLMYFVFACMMLLTYIPIYCYSHTIIYDNVLRESKEQLSNGVNALETAGSLCLNTYTATSNDTRFRILKRKDGLKQASPSELTALVNMLRYALLSNEWITDAGIIGSEPVAITRRNSFYSDQFYSFYPDFMTCEDLTFEQWRALLQSGGMSGVWLSEMRYTQGDYGDAYHALTYARVWSNAKAEQSCVYYATLNTDLLLPCLLDEAILDGGYVKIYNRDGNELLSRISESEQVQEVIRQTSIQTGLTVEIGLPHDYLYRQLVPLERIIMTMIFLFIFIAVVLVLLFSHFSAAPMAHLIHSIGPENMAAPSQRTAFADSDHFLHSKLTQDYAAVADSFFRLNGQLKTNEEIICDQRQKLKEHLFLRALQRVLYSPKEQADFQSAFADFPSPFYLIVLRCSYSQQTIDEMAEICSVMLQTACQTLADVYYAQATNDNTVVLVLSKDHSECMNTLHSLLTAATGLPIRVMQTASFASSTELSDAYYQHLTMELTSSPSAVIQYKDILPENSGRVALPLSMPSLLEMYDALCSGNEALAQIILSECAKSVVDHPEQLMLARHTYSIIGYMLAQLKMEYPVPLFSVVLPTYDARNLEQLFTGDLPACFHAVCEAFTASHAAKNSLSDDVLQFIEKKLFSNDLCVTYVADEFNLAKGTLQKVIKESTGTTFSVYVSTKRLERAYRLLKEPGMTVVRAAEMCGFSSANSFYKAFRRRYGIAPSVVVDTPPSPEEEEAMLKEEAPQSEAHES